MSCWGIGEGNVLSGNPFSNQRMKMSYWGILSLIRDGNVFSGNPFTF